MFSDDEQRDCWDVEGTFNFCMDNNSDKISTNNKQEFCANCLYQTYRKKQSAA